MRDSNKEQKEFGMRSKLPEIVLSKERTLGRKIQINEIAAETGLSRQTVAAWLAPEPFKFVYSHAMYVLMSWADCTLDELLEPVALT